MYQLRMGKTLIVIGVILLVIGMIVEFSNKIPFIGRLPGDIVIEKKNLKFYFPIATSLLVSIILTLLFMLIRWLKN